MAAKAIYTQAQLDAAIKAVAKFVFEQNFVPTDFDNALLNISGAANAAVMSESERIVSDGKVTLAKTVVNYNMVDDSVVIGNALGNTISVDVGNTANISISGGAGNDVIITGVGNDRVDGDAGDDYLRGGAGNDKLNGGAGDDGLYGDAGNDQLSGEKGSDYLVAGTGNDTVDGGAGNDVMHGENGSDSMSGGDGDDSLFGDFPANDDGSINTGDDTLEGGKGDDNIQGEAGNDVLIGGDGKDVIDGGDGNDIITGGAGADTLTGGAGADNFKISQTAENVTLKIKASVDSDPKAKDVITDYSQADGDVITLDVGTAITLIGNYTPAVKAVAYKAATATMPEVQAVTAVAAINTPLQGQAAFDVATNTLFVNTDGDIASEFAITLTGITDAAQITIASA